ncbi:MAG TPA: hypothetical protein DCR14_07195 [Acidimicrobiaceae bacterium]|nr:hypothetical protein [Acidimicrobiaceae bacterium]
MAVYFDERTSQNEERGARRGHRLWWWVAATVVCTVALPVASSGQGASAAPQRAAAVCTGATYTVVSGDGWYLIANKTGVGVSALLAANGATIATPLFPGMRLCLPASSPSTSAPATTTPVSTTPPATVTISQFPVQGTCYFTDTFGAPRSGGRSHEGVDIIAKSGQYIYAATDGTLTKQYIDAAGSLAGNGWRLTRPDGTYFFYAHLSGFQPGVGKGTVVKPGDVIGYVGSTGNASIAHLHFEIHPRGGAAVNPYPAVKAISGC